MHRAVLLHLHREPRGQRVHHRYAHAVQAAGEAVAVLIELGAGVQLGEDQFDAGEFVLAVHVHGHAATVVDHLDGTVQAQGDVYVAAETGQHFVHAVVHHLLNEVVGAARVCIHAGPAAHRLQAGEHLDGFSGIGFVHRSLSLRSRWMSKSARRNSLATLPSSAKCSQR